MFGGNSKSIALAAASMVLAGGLAATPAKATGLNLADPMAPYDWTGLYIGGFGGYAWNELTQLPEDNNGSRDRTDLWLGGLLAGYRLHHSSNFVLGAELVVPLFAEEGEGQDLAFFPAPAFQPPVQYEIEMNEGFIVAGQFGYALGHLLPYAEFGVGRLNMTYRTLNVSGVIYTPGAKQEVSNTHTIVKWGLGADCAVTDNIVMGLRWDHWQTDKQNYETAWNAPPPNSKRFDGDGIFGSLTYKFGGSGGAN